MKIGLISDTHGLLRTEALAALAGCDHLLHAGDIGKPEVLDTLSRTAPLTAVRGNNDEGLAWASELPERIKLSLGGIGIYLTHQAADVPAHLPDSVRVVVTGHSHKPLIEECDGRLWVNPGSAGPRRFKLLIGIALLHLENGAVRAELVALQLTPT
ncbi:metallophosphoesterase family protein [Aquipseudomonas alcaligenes]|uniref:Phosphoesterase n=1 Tax=Aquipseudomonas alcaligenes TaxID=43263 RepID=A0AA37CFY0_AQUAC|nr:metallophosphoesterase family protein [Pseudomonas alcaligenes]BCR26712.1 phosphoesterase [Pseudomonas alcaligenes]GIZ65692.1 phosphoesterase [Pseudomonas alcaligenes]GIZ70026.1 phosphoesterase [Pseudomonas alcaligenes]GIZ74379.1 phosphoesterase [Pseudomonas alcaligenes]GIZ78707.1 phosphoesterase [Pseudomonas alcaligenes]